MIAEECRSISGNEICISCDTSVFFRMDLAEAVHVPAKRICEKPMSKNTFIRKYFGDDFYYSGNSGGTFGNVSYLTVSYGKAGRMCAILS